MPRKKDPNIIRVGDKVKIIKPEFFVRVGYPMTPDSAFEEISDLFSKEIHEFLNKIEPRGSGMNNALSIGEMDKNRRAFDRIARALSYDWVKARGFGGRERRIYSKPVEVGKDCIAEVTGIKYVKTGDYQPGSGGNYNGWSGDYDDYEPAYLANEKTHKILEVAYRRIVFADHDDWIEAANVEKILETEEVESVS